MTPVFIVLSALLVASALAVVLMENPLHSALALIVNLVSVACVFASLNAHFLAVVQVIVYAGAIMVLVLFVLMLLSVKNEEKSAITWSQIALGGAFGICFVGAVAKVSLQQWGAGAVILAKGIVGKNSAVLGKTATSVEGTVEAVGEVLYTNYLFPFEAASILIMSAIVGATMLAKAKRGNRKVLESSSLNTASLSTGSQDKEVAKETLQEAV